MNSRNARESTGLEFCPNQPTMKNNCSQTFAALALVFGLGVSSAQAAAPAKAQGLIAGKAYLGITGNAVANLIASTNFPNNPSAEQFPGYFEWAATGDIATPPGNWADNYGTQMVGYFYPPATGDYIFWIASDDGSELYLSTDADPVNKKLIARESVWSNSREYLTSGGASDLTMKDSSQFAGTQWPTKDAALGGAKITLQAGRAYYIEALSKEGGGGDNLSVAVQNPGATIDSTLPIPGIYLSSDRSDGPVTIANQPQSQTVDERGSVTFRVRADGLPPYSYQWRKGGTAIADATNLTYSVASAVVADNNTRYSVVVTGAQGTATSQDAVLTVAPDKVPPTVLGVKGSPNLTEVVLTFSEKVDQATANAVANYQISAPTGSLNVTAAALSASGTTVVLTTAKQTLGTKYSILLSNIKDTAATPNTIAASSKIVFFPTGKLVETNGFIVFEAENYDRNLDDIWVRDTTRGNPSGGASVVAPNGVGGSEAATKLEYDVEFKQVATYKIWYRASGNDGADDSSWFHIDGERPAERLDGNSAAMTGFSGALDFVWRAESFGGVQPMSVDIATAGPHVVGLARREDGSFFDKFILTTDMAFNPTGFGPAETREGAPSSPTITLTAPTSGQSFTKGANITLSANATTDARVDIVRVEFLANGKVVGEDTAAPYTFTWNNVADGIYSVAARVVDELRASSTTPAVGIAVVGGTAKQYQQDAAGLVVMEAENFDGLTPAPDGHTWTIGADRAGFSGTGHVQSLPNSGVNQSVNPDLLTQSPRLDYNVKFVKSGTHYLWILGGDPDATGAGDSVNAGINGVNPPTALRIDGAPGFNIAAGWNWVGNIQGDTRATIEVPSAGNHVVNIWMREDGFYFDKLIVTSDANFTPTGTGPTESVRTGGEVQPQAPRALLVVGTDSNPVLNASDAGLKARLESKGWKITVVQAPAAVTADGDVQQLIIVSSTVNSGDVANKFRNSAVPVLNWEQAVQDNFLMTLDTATDHATLAGQTQINVVKADHPLAGGVSTGVKTMTTEAQEYSWGAPNQNAVIIATIADNPAQALIYGYEKGAILADGTTPAPARRVMFFWGNNGFAASTEDAIKLFDAAVEWASGIKPSVGPGAPTLSLTRTATGISIAFTGTLQSANSVTGPWTDEAAVASPLAVTPTGGMKFYRAKQ
jgi:hypothetical protein